MTVARRLSFLFTAGGALLLAGTLPRVIIAAPPRAGLPTNSNPASDDVEELQIGDPPPPGKEGGAGEHLIVPGAISKQIEDTGDASKSKAAAVARRKMALETLKLATEYARQQISRTEPPRPSKVRNFLGLYGLPFRYGQSGGYVPYCASGVGFTACRVHYRLAWPLDHPTDPAHADPGDDPGKVRAAIPDVTRDYCFTHPSCRMMVEAAKKRKHRDGKSFWLPRTKGVVPKPGWLVFYNWVGRQKPQHVGIVDDPVFTKTTKPELRTVEFNTSDPSQRSRGDLVASQSNGGRVVKKHRPLRYVLGYIRTYP
jgi:hypothetical protein